MSKRRVQKSSPPAAEAVAITEAEWDIMELLWEKSPRTSQEIVALLEEGRGWKRATVVTLLARLTSKGALVTEPQGNRFLYSPAVERSACVAEETRSFVERMFGGALQPLVAHVAEHHSLSKKDIAELKALLDQIKPNA
ncbi:BlaI/MecI/CopY family transcriptional regulator [Prosthecobacter fluviatilis]|uniref:BlaI/MecI/CopY family transcriptional regulator n=1 Tax=Prosthecobacter fluviatilis TaxID=445931 RepID=A0ABW0KRS4_9BACT